MNKSFILVDCNSFYASCEKVFRPELKNKPVVVLSNNDGCVISRTREAKEIGIPMGVPIHKLDKNLINKHCVSIFSSNFTLYGDLSERVMETLKEFTDEIEIYSIDEAFLKISQLNPEQLLLLGEDIKKRIYKNTGIPVSVGLAPTKVLSKIANHYGKQSKTNIYSLMEQNQRDFSLRNFPVEKIWGIGRRLAIRLLDKNITTAKELSECDYGVIKKIMGIHGERIVRELQSEPCLQLEDHLTDKKSILTSRSFGKTVTSLIELKEALSSFVSIASEKLRKQNSICCHIQVFIQTSPFGDMPYYRSSGYKQLLTGTSSTRALIKMSHEILENIFKPGQAYKRCGIYLSDLYQENQTQLNLFQNIESAKDAKLMKAIDYINKNLGYRGVGFSLPQHNNWKMRQLRRSPNYTTSWNDILTL